MRSFEEHKQYLKDLISHYDELIEMKPRNALVSSFLNFIKDEKYKQMLKDRIKMYNHSTSYGLFLFAGIFSMVYLSLPLVKNN